jgi:hypothetical protein
VRVCIDRTGQQLEAGAQVRICSVESCSRGLPDADQQLMRLVVGGVHVIADIDEFGFPWFYIELNSRNASFCLLPSEIVALAP